MILFHYEKLFKFNWERKMILFHYRAYKKLSKCKTLGTRDYEQLNTCIWYMHVICVLDKGYQGHLLNTETN